MLLKFILLRGRKKRVVERQPEKGKEVLEQEVKGRGRERAIKLEEGGFHEEVI